MYWADEQGQSPHGAQAVETDFRTLLEHCRGALKFSELYHTIIDLGDQFPWRFVLIDHYGRRKDERRLSYQTQVVRAN